MEVGTCGCDKDGEELSEYPWRLYDLAGYVAVGVTTCVVEGACVESVWDLWGQQKTIQSG
jgi:hypothetical protein